MNIIHAAQARQGGGPVSIACINMATADLGVPFEKLTAALQKCFYEHFLPVWGYPVKLYNTKTPEPNDWQFVYFDDADTAGALGYHDLTKNGQPISKVFVQTTIDANRRGHRSEYRKPLGKGLRILPGRKRLKKR